MTKSDLRLWGRGNVFDHFTIISNEKHTVLVSFEGWEVEGLLVQK